MKNGRIASSVMLGCLLTLSMSDALVQAAVTFPARPVRLVVPYAPGGATDITARHLADGLNKTWRQTVIVENRPGASGNIALDMAARATPDGYTLFVGNVSTNAINETTFAKSLKTKPSRDLTGLTNLIELPHLFVCSTALPVASLKQFIDYAKKSGGRLNYASAGVGSYPHLDAVVFMKATGIQMTHVPYKGGAGQMIPAIMGNEVQFMEINMASSISNIRAGRIRALATTWPTRRSEFPDVPTMAELGYPGVGTNAWNGLFAPAKVSKTVLAKIHNDVIRVMESPAMKTTLDKSFMSVVVNKSPAEFDDFVQKEVRKWGKIVTENHVTVE